VVRSEKIMDDDRSHVEQHTGDLVGVLGRLVSGHEDIEEKAGSGKLPGWTVVGFTVRA